MPTGFLPEDYDVPRPYGPAPPDRVHVVQSAYWQAREACSEADARVSLVAEMARSPSTILTRARELAARPAAGRELSDQGRRGNPVGDVAVYEPRTRLGRSSGP